MTGGLLFGGMIPSLTAVRSNFDSAGSFCSEYFPFTCKDFTGISCCRGTGVSFCEDSLVLELGGVQEGVDGDLEFGGAYDILSWNYLSEYLSLIICRFLLTSSSSPCSSM